MKKKAFIIGLGIICCLFLSSCKHSHNDLVDLSSQNGFWKAVNLYEYMADDIFQDIEESNNISAEEIQKLTTIQEKLESTYKTASKSPYSGNVSYFLDDEHKIYNCLVVITDPVFSANYHSLTFSECDFTIAEDSTYYATFIKNMSGSVFKKNDNHSSKEIYTVIEPEQDAYILVRGENCLPVLYKISGKKTPTIIKIVKNNKTITLWLSAMAIIAGIISIIVIKEFFLNTIDLTTKAITFFFCIVPSIMLILGGIFALVIMITPLEILLNM